MQIFLMDRLRWEGEIMILHDAKELHKSAFWLQTDASVVNSDEYGWF